MKLLIFVFILLTAATSFACTKNDIDSMINRHANRYNDGEVINLHIAHSLRNQLGDNGEVIASFYQPLFRYDIVQDDGYIISAVGSGKFNKKDCSITELSSTFF